MLDRFEESSISDESGVTAQLQTNCCATANVKRARSELPRELASFDNELAAVFGLRRMGEAIIEQDADAHAASEAPNKIDVLLPVRRALGLIPIAALRLLSRTSKDNPLISAPSKPGEDAPPPVRVKLRRVNANLRENYPPDGETKSVVEAAKESLWHHLERFRQCLSVAIAGRC